MLSKVTENTAMAGLGPKDRISLKLQNFVVGLKKKKRISLAYSASPIVKPFQKYCWKKKKSKL